MKDKKMKLNLSLEIENEDLINFIENNKESVENHIYKNVKKELNSLVKKDGETEIVNDIILIFWNNFKDQFVWDILPYNFLYDLFESWYKENINPIEVPISKNIFIRRLKSIIRTNENKKWKYTGNNEKKTSKDLLIKSEPLILKYNLKRWKNKEYEGDNKSIMCIPSDIQVAYRGVYRETKNG